MFEMVLDLAEKAVSASIRTCAVPEGNGIEEEHASGENKGAQRSCVAGL